MTKTCKVCKKEKEISEFSASAKYGVYCYRCKECRNAWSRERYKDPKIKKAQNKKNRQHYWKNRDEIRKRAKEKRRAEMQTLDGLAKNMEATKRAYHRNLKKSRARVALRQAIFHARIIKPENCELCGRGGCRINGHHHNGYDNPLDVQWLCDGCHAKKHRRKRPPRIKKQPNTFEDLPF